MTLHDQFKELWDRTREQRGQPAEASQAAAAAFPGPHTPWEGIREVAESLGINLGQLWQTRENELKAAREAADETARELHELRLREIDGRVQQLQAMAEKVQSAHASESSVEPKGFLERLDEITNGMVTRRITAGLFGNGDNQARRNPVEDLMDQADQFEKLKQRFGNPGPSGAHALVSQATPVRTELMKLLLEDERERMKLQFEHEAQSERNKHLGTLASTVKDNFEDAVAAARDMLKDHRQREKKREQPPPDSGEGYGVRCSLCGGVSTFEEEPSGEIECQHCKRTLRVGPQGGGSSLEF